ncbi:hypothetical protein GCM10009662_44330 [Catellatospora coxensis]
MRHLRSLAEARRDAGAQAGPELSEIRSAIWADVAIATAGDLLCTAPISDAQIASEMDIGH